MPYDRQPPARDGAPVGIVGAIDTLGTLLATGMERWEAFGQVVDAVGLDPVRPYWDGLLCLEGCVNLEWLPRDLHVGGSLFLDGCHKLDTLPAWLYVMDELFIRDVNGWDRVIPMDAVIGGFVFGTMDRDDNGARVGLTIAKWREWVKDLSERGTA
jgi:hypothetical protein